MAEKEESVFPRVKGRVVVDFGGEATYGSERSLTLREARLLVNRLLAQLNRAGVNKKK